jgi:ABC-type glycerol-3-phosphate transport system permease component
MGTALLRIAIVALLSVIALTTLYPLFFTLNASFKTQKEWSLNNFRLSVPPDVGNYVDAWNRSAVPRTFLNSIVVTAGGVLGALLICTMAAFSASKLKFSGNNVIFLILLASMIVPIQTILYPFYKTMNDFKLTNRYVGMILTYVAFGIPLTTYQLAAYFKSIPDSLIESAKMDGASLLRVIFQIIFPISRPVVFTVSLINFVWMWNELLMPVTVMNNPKMYTLIQSLALLRGQYGAFPTLISAGVVIGIIPVSLIYFIAQKQIIKGMTLGAVKG